MLVKTISGKYGRISKDQPGNINVKVMMLDNNLFPVMKYGKKVYEYFKPYELIYRPEIIVKL